MLLEVAHLTKDYGGSRVVDDVSFEVAEGELVGLVGPNGAGKTTTIHMVLGLITPTSGDVRIFGLPFAANRETILQAMNFTAPYVMYPGRLTVRENLMVFAGLYDVRRPEKKINELLRLFSIEHLGDKPVSRLSSGETTRVGLCKAFLNDPRFLMLDEPTAFLDPQIAYQVRTVLGEIRRRSGLTVLYTSHNMAEVEALCDRVYFLSRGRILASGTPIEVTNAILTGHREVPALGEVFMQVATRQP